MTENHLFAYTRGVFTSRKIEKLTEDGFIREFKEYQTEKYDVNRHIIPESLTQKG